MTDQGAEEQKDAPITDVGAPRIDIFSVPLADSGGGPIHAILVEVADLASALANLDETETDETNEHVRQALVESVMRPLLQALRDSEGKSEADNAGLDAKRSDGSPPTPTFTKDSLDERLWNLTKTATELRAQPNSPTGLIEAVASLQALAVRSAAVHDSRIDSRIKELRSLQAGLTAGIQVAVDGPYLVTNAETIGDYLGLPIPATPQMALCRCGQSANKPFCDGSHSRVGFCGAKDPQRVADRRDTYDGQQITILDNRGICAHSGFCTDRLNTVFHADSEPFVTPSGARMDEIIRAVRACPSGALSMALDGEEIRDHVDLNRPPSIEVSKDGPYRVTGGLELIDAEGKPEVRVAGASTEHYSLCRCGHSKNKPFCSGMHWYVEFHDPAPEPDRTPTVFEWCGGLPALKRMTRIFYEKHVPSDPILAPLFSTMSVDHAERVAAWLAEVFGGPKAYSEVCGGYTRMISQHLGKEITEEKRARWVELLQLSAFEAGMPNDPEFRSVFASYVEWGSRLAVENSQIGAKPPEHMPMPHWDWNTASGPPGSRVSAHAAASAPVEDTPIVFPADDEQVSFAKHIRTLFRHHDRQSMTFAFDLWSFDDVHRHSSEILKRLRAGSMPCDGAWPPERVEVFQRWVDTGMLA